MKSQFSEQDHSNKGTNASGGGSGGNASTTNSNLIPQARSNDQRLAAALSYQNALLHQLQQPNCKKEFPYGFTSTLEFGLGFFAPYDRILPLYLADPGATTLALPRFQ